MVEQGKVLLAEGTRAETGVDGEERVLLTVLVDSVEEEEELLVVHRCSEDSMSLFSKEGEQMEGEGEELWLFSGWLGKPCLKQIQLPRLAFVRYKT